MRCRILHESPGRMRVRMLPSVMTVKEADLLEYYLRNAGFVSDVRVCERTGDAMIRYGGSEENRRKLIRMLSRFSYADPAAAELVPEKTGREMNRRYEEKLVSRIAWRVLRRVLVPVPVRTAFTVLKSFGYIRRALGLLSEGKLEVPVLDAAAITASVLRGDYPTASSVMFLLETGELLEEWTHRKSVDDLARSMSLKVDRVWLKNGEEEVLVPVREVRAGDRILVRTSNVIPLDGKVLSGAAMVNQAAMTGESVPVEKQQGGYVYAGTVVENGECVIEVTKTAGTGKYDQIVRMIEESEKLKSETETAAFHLADRLVPYSLAGCAVAYLLTRNVNRALAFLMVDYSCALKLSMPLSVLSAIREAGQYQITAKGGRFLEAAARADTIVFDKTGTLTHAQPTVVQIVTFGGADENECLRTAACLEEHYPHSIANAVVKEAEKRGLVHEERHSSVKYVVAHGIASEIDGRKAVIGSRHFVFEDEQCTVPAGEEEKLAKLPDEYSHLFMAVGGVLTAVLCIFDPLRGEAPYVIDQLRRLGVGKICMMTGDNEQTAAAVARGLAIDEYHAGVMPGDKAEFIRKEHEAGRKVIMIGDGINDTPALSEADVGIAISDGAAIAREIADITIAADDLFPLIRLREISMALMDRIDSNYRFIMGFNTILIILGALGILPPASSALLHNGSTIAAGLRSMTRLLPQENAPGKSAAGMEKHENLKGEYTYEVA